MSSFTGLPTFDYLRAGSVDEVNRFLQENSGDARLFMGGTDLFLQLRAGSISPSCLIDIKDLPGMQEISFSETDGLSIGAAVTINQIAAFCENTDRYLLLAEAARSMASYQLCNRATLGGNLCNASPGADMAPAALVLQARLVVNGPGGEREIPVDDFYLGPGQTTLKKDEFLLRIIFPVPPSGTVARYLKLGRNKAGDLAVVGVAVMGYPDTVAASGFSWRIALASVAPTPIRALEAEAILSQTMWSEETAARASEATAAAARPITDIRSSAAYRRAMVRTQTLRAVTAVYAVLGKDS